jgi:hypothetical protein
MPTDKPAWSPPEVFKEDPAAERGFDEQHLQSTIDDFVRKYGKMATLVALNEAGKRIAGQLIAADSDSALDIINKG